jgi:hypothetical protein
VLLSPTLKNIYIISFFPLVNCICPPGALILLINLYLFYCELCQKNQIGDEYHYIFECTNLSEKRTSLLPKHLIERPNIIKFKNLMTSERKPILQKLCKFIRYINMIVCPPG